MCARLCALEHDSGERGQSRVGAADLQCGVTVETVDSQNPSSYDHCVPRVCLYVTSVCACVRMCACGARVRVLEGGLRVAEQLRAECGCTRG